MVCADASIRATNIDTHRSNSIRPNAPRSGANMPVNAGGRRIEELESFVHGMAHDASALTRGIMLRTELLREHLGNQASPQTEHLLTGIAERADRLGRMSDALLRLARIGTHDIEREEIDLSALASDVLEELRRDHPDRSAECIVRPGMTAYADRALVRLLLENLLGNAWKYTARAPATRIEVGCRSTGGEAAYYIADNGIGLTHDATAELFSPFVRLAAAQSFPGTGLGLAIAKQIVERHGGWIRADDAARQGADFVFSLGTASRPSNGAGTA
jgi:signal transduction histidine kinase